MFHKNGSFTTYQKRALVLSSLLLLLALGSLGAILCSNKNSPTLYAHIYHHGELLQTIPLSSVSEGYTLLIEDDRGQFNEIQVQTGSIGIISASCPDKLCIHQGFIHTSLLPITCLPNALVIQIEESAEELDSITY